MSASSRDEVFWAGAADRGGFDPGTGRETGGLDLDDDDEVEVVEGEGCFPMNEFNASTESRCRAGFSTGAFSNAPRSKRSLPVAGAGYI